MLNWWLGKPMGGTENEDGNIEIEPPETPAPVFAARALKSAFFGTPAPPKDDISYIHSAQTTLEHTADNRKQQADHISPKKPAGILLTPGTATSRRKTVSFGNEIISKEVVAVKRAGKTDKNRQHKSSRSISLTKALESAREERLVREGLDKSRNSVDTSPLLDLEDIEEGGLGLPPDFTDVRRKNSTDHNFLEEFMKDEAEGDMTMDLNEPRSQSGRFWKSEFETYHEQAKSEMRKLLKYKQMAKNYAKMKDAEVLDLNHKLKEEQHRVMRMEEKVSKISARITRVGHDGYDADEDSPELVKELARQTSLAVQYKKQVDEFQTAIQGAATQPIATKEVLAIPEDKDSSTHVSLLREEILRLQRDLRSAEKETSRLWEENKNLRQDLVHSDLKLERLSEKMEKRRLSFEETRRKKDEAMDQLQGNYDHLKEQAKSQRKDAEQLLRKRQEQVMELKKEIAANRNLEVTIKDLQESLEKKTIEYSRVVAEYEIQIAELKRDVILGPDTGLNLRASIQRDPSLSNSLAKHEAAKESPLKSHDSQIPIASQSISRPSKAAAHQSRSETPTSSPPKKAHPVLSEVINNASPNTIPPLQFGPVQFTPAIHRFSDMSMSNPDFDLPSPEPSILSGSSRTIHERKCHPSPRPTMVHLPSSPPKPARMRSQNPEVVRVNGGERAPVIGSSRLNVMEDSRVRRSVPPERAAAAKARLEQKNAEKRKAALAGKENIQS